MNAIKHFVTILSVIRVILDTMWAVRRLILKQCLVFARDF